MLALDGAYDTKFTLPPPLEIGLCRARTESYAAIRAGQSVGPPRGRLYRRGSTEPVPPCAWFDK